MKKFLSILLILAMMFGTVAMAEENGAPAAPPSGDMAPPSGENGQPPEKPDGEQTPSGGENGQPPEKPDGAAERLPEEALHPLNTLRPRK